MAKCPYENNSPEYQLWNFIESQVSLENTYRKETEEAQKKLNTARSTKNLYVEALKKLDPTYEE